MKYLAFVTMELYPLTAGGIGRVMYNILETMSPEDRARTVVLLTADGIDIRLAQAMFQDVRFETLSDVGTVGDSDRYPPKFAYTNTEWHWRSVCVLRKLQKLEQAGIKFEYIEFPDWGGLGFAATQEKLFSNAFSGASLAVRLHCSEGMIMSAEAHLLDRSALGLYDIERKTLRDCDIVVAQLIPVAHCNRELYGFEEKEWSPRIILHRPPVLIDQAIKSETLRFASDTPLLFTSKFQQVKAPDVFVRACIGFMRTCPEYCGEVRFLAHNTDSEYVAYIKTLIPTDLMHRFRFYENAISGLLREEMISKGLAVFPSRFESFCLAAYEASLLGSLVILNESNPAFGFDTPWVDGKNCVKYDGSVEGLVTTLRRLMQTTISGSLEPVSLPSSIPPWKVTELDCDEARASGDKDLPLVSVVIPNFNLGAYLPYTVRSVVDSTYPNLEIIICDDASTDPYTIEVIERLQISKAVRLIRAGYNRGLAGVRNLAIREARGAYIFTLDADDLISSDFIEKAVGALERNPEYAIVVPQTAYFPEGRNEIPKVQTEYIDFAIFHGEALACGFTENRFSTATMLARRTLFDKLAYREELRALEDWDFYLRSVQLGERFIVTNELHFYYRKRQGSMISAVDDRERAKVLREDVKRIHFFRDGNMTIPSSAFSIMQEVSDVHASPSSVQQNIIAELEGYRNSEAVRTALYVANFLNSRAPRLLHYLKSSGTKAWRAYNKMRGRVL